LFVTGTWQEATMVRHILGDRAFVIPARSNIIGRHFDNIHLMDGWDRLDWVLAHRWFRECVTCRLKDKKTGRIFGGTA
jgi:hypothetical protein